MIGGILGLAERCANCAISALPSNNASQQQLTGDPKMSDQARLSFTLASSRIFRIAFAGRCPPMIFRRRRGPVAEFP